MSESRVDSNPTCSRGNAGGGGPNSSLGGTGRYLHQLRPLLQSKPHQTEAPTLMASVVLNNQDLTCAIFQWLKEIVNVDVREARSSAQSPTPPVARRSLFALLATINKAFFFGSVDVLWESLESVLPLFGYALPADRYQDGRLCAGLSYDQNTLTPGHWARFLLYASRVKFLVLSSRTSLSMNPSWLFLLMNSQGRPSVLLPSLKHLSLATNDPLSLYIASNSMPILKSVSLDFTCEPSFTAHGHGQAIATLLVRNAIVLTNLRLTHPVTPRIVERVAQIRTLNVLHLTIARNQNIRPLHIDRLSSLRALHTLSISEQNLDQMDTSERDIPNDLKIGEDHHSYNSTVKHLCVKATSATQMIVAVALKPMRLETLDVEVLPDVGKRQLGVIPFFATMYASNNRRSLTDLSIYVADDPPTETMIVDPEVWAQLRTRDALDQSVKFVDAISHLINLRRLKISNIPFVAVDLVPRLLEVVPKLPRLGTLHLIPWNATQLSEDEPVVPPLQVLETLCRQNRFLKRLKIAVEIPQVLPHPSSTVPAHGLQMLGLQSSSANYANIKIEDRFKLARYIARLFPQAKVVVDGVSSEETEFWVFINHLLSFSRDTRSQTLCEVERLMGIRP
ncbi:hypothetical protein NMY22_g13852 [Coprinellus aureogranulatus]|nr:hypothetical protein NMY22_g13852 [Coprinellus aureogranulatus]